MRRIGRYAGAIIIAALLLVTADRAVAQSSDGGGAQPPRKAATAKSAKKSGSKNIRNANVGDSWGADEEVLDGPPDEAVAALYDKKRLCQAASYPVLRKAVSEAFQRRHEAEIKQGLGADYDAMMEWFAAHNETKEEFFTALNAHYDKIPAACELFNTLRKQFPKKIAAYANLALAVAVVWDDDKQGVYDYVHHQKRTHSLLPEGRLGAVDNFQYFLDAEDWMQGRAQFLPWEFLVHMVNHRTPLVDRQWAQANYLSQRAMIGKCYKDCPYDHEMLISNSKNCRLDGKPYTLPMLRQWGGVCAMQADYAARVAKSLGVPAESVGGESNSGELHAWVMWVELVNVTKSTIVFSLQSYGRYRGDQYYVGHLRDPHTGRPMTDRELELRLHMVGDNAAAKRQAALAMRVFPQLRTAKNFEVGDELAYFNQVIKLCPGNEDAWMGAARLAKEGKIGRGRYKQMTLILDQLFRTFAAVPDFTWKVFDDLTSFQESPKLRIGYYERLVALYEQATRPDLACEARLKLSDYQVAQQRVNDAIEGLAMSIKKFPSEGRYVPRMLDKLEAICETAGGKQDQLLLFYKQFLPMVPRLRGQTPTPYCMAMYKRGIDRFRQAGQTQFAETLEAQLSQLKAALPSAKQ